jgi:hypothetical protein
MQRTGDESRRVASDDRGSQQAAKLLCDLITLLLQNHIDAHHSSDDELTNRIISRNIIGNLKHIVIGGGKQLFAQASPFLLNMRKLAVTTDKTKIPACLFSFQRTKLLVIGTEHPKCAAERKEFLFESPMRESSSSSTSTLDRKRETPRVTESTGSPEGLFRST